jgi:hypothetical protein
MNEMKNQIKAFMKTNLLEQSLIFELFFCMKEKKMNVAEGSYLHKLMEGVMGDIH